MLTGQEYRESLNDGRQIYLRGKRVENVATHPAFRPTVEDAASGYDRYYQSGPDATAPYYDIARSVEESSRARRSTAHVGHAVHVYRYRNQCSHDRGQSYAQ